ncbi:MAG: alpha/beta hydrolase fold domain-containing protein, partial [Planctomycetaceae bacterium]|nr:alpha/beta hydrolase fold domain-containing protein [Planctomycetaceae bacterium]
MRTLLLVLTLALTAQAAGPVGDKHVYKTVDGRELSLYVVSPETNGKPQMAPAVVFYHGGGWTGGQPTQFNDWATHLASRGMVAIQVQYRLLDKSTKDP